MAVAITNNNVNSELLNSMQQPDNEVQNTAPIKEPALSFIDKHIHPPSAVPGYVGMPTNDTRTQVVTNWIDLRSNTVPTIPNNFGSPPIPSSSSAIDGFAILHTSGIRHANIAFFHQNADIVAWHQDVANTPRLSVYDTNRFQYDATKFRPAYRSTTITLNATAFNNVGVLSSCQFNPPMLWSGDILNLSEKHPKKFAAFLKAFVKAHGITNIKREHLLEFGVQHQETIRKLLKVDQPPRVQRNADGFEEVIEEPKLDPNTAIQFVSFGKQGNNESGNLTGAVVPTHEQIMNLSARAYGGAARDGNFLVQRVNTVAPRWITAANDNEATNVNAGMYECYYAFEDLAGNDNFKPFTELASDGVNCRSLLDVQWSEDMTWGWTLMTGLVPNTNIGAGVVNPDLMILKSYVGTEIQPAAMSAWAGMQQESPRPNMQAMQALMTAYYDLKDGMPAKFNFAGLGKVIKLAAQTILPTLVQGLAGRPAKRRAARAQPKPNATPVADRTRSKSRPRDTVPWKNVPVRRTRGRSKSYEGMYYRANDGWMDGGGMSPRERNREANGGRRPTMVFRSSTRSRRNVAVAKTERDLADAQRQMSKLKV